MAENIDAGTSLDAQILAAYQKFYGRPASTEEIEDASNFIKSTFIDRFLSCNGLTPMSFYLLSDVGVKDILITRNDFLSHSV